MKNKNNVFHAVLQTSLKNFWLSLGILLSVATSILLSLFTPLVLGFIIDKLTLGVKLSAIMVIIYFGCLVLNGIADSLRESLLIIFGQKITHNLRSRLSEKLTMLTANDITGQEPGALVSRFVGDVNTVESLFTSGIISIIADGCKIIGIMIMIWTKTKGLAIVLCVVLPLVFLFTRMVQKKTLTAQLTNRVALSHVSNLVPESLHCIRTIHNLQKEQYMEDRYNTHIEKSYNAVEKTNFYDSIYSPVILVLNAVIVAAVMILSASGNPKILSFFGMTVGTAVAIINYISEIFSPLESLGMEIQTIQSAIAGAERINNFLKKTGRWETKENITNSPQTTTFKQSITTTTINSNSQPHTTKTEPNQTPCPCVELHNVTFGYDNEKTILDNVSLTINPGEQVTIAGRTGIGKSTIFKLLLGLYKPQSGQILINGTDAHLIEDSTKRKIFGYVDQTFHMVTGTIKDQITLFDPSITDEMVETAAKLTGLHETITSLEKGYKTHCIPSLLSQGQWQLLSIARAVAAQPKILLFDEITANLDADTEQTVLKALKNISENRTVISISHRIYENTQSRLIKI